MSDVTSRPREDSCELEPVTCWPLIYACGGFLLMGVLFAGGLFVHDWLRPLSPVAASTPGAPKPAPEHQVAAIDRGPEPSTVAPAEPPRSPPARRVVGEYVPLPPATPAEHDYRPSVRLARKERMDESVRLVRKAKTEVKVAKSDGATLPPTPPNLSPLVLEPLLQKQAREIDLGNAGDGKKLLEAAKEQLAKRKKDEEVSFSSPLEKLLASRDDLTGLPLLAGKACQTDKEQARVLGEVSVSFRRLQARATRNERSKSTSRSHYPTPSQSTSLQPPEELGYVDPGLKKYLDDCFESVKEKQRLVGPLEQTYQAESAGMRVELVAALAQIEGKEATQALARRATYDLSPTVRKAAVAALKKRKFAEAREVFLSAFRHPWAPAADHAALALVELEDQSAIPSLSSMLDQPDPSAPEKVGGKWVSKELVRVNHLQNCLLCHAPSMDTKDLVRAPVPTPGQALPEVYYDRQRNSNNPSVRADVVYFRQDFSAMHAVEKPNKWPAIQRFDYLVQARPLDAKEAEKRLEQARAQKTYPQREALRWALGRLKGSELDRID